MRIHADPDPQPCLQPLCTLLYAPPCGLHVANNKDGAGGERGENWLDIQYIHTYIVHTLVHTTMYKF